MQRLLFVELDPELRHEFERHFAGAGRMVLATSDLTRALYRVHSYRPDAIILGLNDANDFVRGLAICRAIREQDARLIVILVSTSVGERRVLDGFEAGADDVMGKPISLPELQARLDARLQNTPGLCAWVGDAVVDFDKLLVRHPSGNSPLSAREGQALRYLVSRRDVVVGREEIFEKIWGNVAIDIRVVNVHICNIRKKLHCSVGAHEGIETVHAVGYRFRGSK